MKTSLVTISSYKVKGSDCYPAADYDFYQICGKDAFDADAYYLIEVATQAEADKIVAEIKANGLVIDATPETWDVIVSYSTVAWLKQGMEAASMDDEERSHKGI